MNKTDLKPVCPGYIPEGVPADAGQEGGSVGLGPQCSTTREAQVHGTAGAAPYHWRRLHCFRPLLPSNVARVTEEAC